MVTKKYGNRKQRLENVVEIPPDQAQDEICQASGHSIEREKKTLRLPEKECKTCKFL